MLNIARQFSSTLNPFHLAIPVSNLIKSKEFYGSIMELPEGRSAPNWQDYDLFGHQLVIHEVSSHTPSNNKQPVDGDDVPVPHFGVCLSVKEFHELANKLKNNDIKFIIPPHKRFEGKQGEQWTMFFSDPSSNYLEFKAMTNPENLFTKEK